MQGITQAIDSRDGVFIGGTNLRHTKNTLKTMSTSFYNESIDQELSIKELGQAAGGFAFVPVPLALEVWKKSLEKELPKIIQNMTQNDGSSPTEQEGEKSDKPEE